MAQPRSAATTGSGRGNPHLLSLMLVLAVSPTAIVSASETAPEVRVHLASSAGPEAQTLLDSGIQALHDFWYQRAIEQFREAQKLEPDLVLAYVGEGLAVHDPFGLGACSTGPMQQVLERLGTSPEERFSKARSPRERAYLAAFESLAGEGDTEERHRAFATAMGKLAGDFPEDLEALALYALSLFGTADNLRKYPELREEVAAVTTQVLAREPLHPGGLHYAIHALDTPDEAHRVLDIARRYLEVAAAPHAIHMSSHVFLQHGLFEDSIAANRKAFELSERWAAETDRPATALAWHAADFLHYSLLQLGRVEEASSWRRRLEGEDHGMLQYFRALWEAREAIERGTSTKQNSNFGSRTEMLAEAMAALRTGDLAATQSLLADAANRVEENKGDRSASGNYQRWQVLEAELDALIRSHQGDHAGAIESARRAIDYADQAPPPNETPDPPIPPRELLGDLLLAAGRPAEAARAYTAALAHWRGRLRSSLGFARASAAAGLPHASLEAYQRLAIQLQRADDLAETKEVREATASPETTDSGGVF